MTHLQGKAVLLGHPVYISNISVLICNDSLNVLSRVSDHFSRNEEISFGKF
jgi:hypothetical protein